MVSRLFMSICLSLMSAIALSSHRCAAATLLAHYAFEEGCGDTTADVSGGGTPARLVGDVSFTAEGRYGLAIECAGFGEWVDTGRSILDTSASFSVAAWIQLAEGFAEDFRTVVSQDDAQVSGFYLQYALARTGPASDALRLNRWARPDGGSIAAAHSGARPPIGQWIHVCGVQHVDAHRLRLYVDGDLVQETAYDPAGGAYQWRASGNTIIGRGLFRAGPVDAFLGRIDEVYLFQGMLNDEEIGRVRDDRYLSRPPPRGDASRVDNVQSVRIDPAAGGDLISPLLFGQNLEHTRRAVWRGLSAQLLANRKFAARGEGGLPARWYRAGAPSTGLALDVKNPFASGPSLRIAIASAGSVGGIGQSDIPVQAGGSYDAKMRLKSNRQVRVAARFVDAGGQKGMAGETLALEPFDWQEWNFRLTAPQTQTAARFEITFEGPGVVWIGATSLMPSDSPLGMRRDVLKLLKSLEPSWLRWPGGNFTRDYRWQDGMLPADRRPPTHTQFPEVLPFTDHLDEHDLGTDEFIALCGEVGAQPSITLTLDPAICPPAGAAAWVEYCNGRASTTWGRKRAERGHREPYAVKYWSIGNEIWGRWMGPAHCDAATYARRVREYAAAMKRADPSIVLIASGQPGRWDKTLVEQARGHFDLLSEHNYAPVAAALSGYAGRKEMHRLAMYPAGEMLGLIRGVRDLLGARDQRDGDVGIAFDEWNVWHNWFGNPFKNEWCVGPIDGVYVAATLNMLCREAPSLGVDMAAFFQPVNEGLIAVEPFTSRLTAVGQAWLLLNAHRGNRGLKLAQRRTGGALDVCASACSGGTRICLSFVNRSPAREQVMELQLAPDTVANPGMLKRLVAADPAPDAAFQERSERLVFRSGRARVTLPPASIALGEFTLSRSGR